MIGSEVLDLKTFTENFRGPQKTVWGLLGLAVNCPPLTEVILTISSILDSVDEVILVRER